MRDPITVTVEKNAAALAEWDAGRAASPSPLDYVLHADLALRETLPGYEAPTTLTPLDAIADEMSDAMEDSDTLADLDEMATYAVARLLGLDVEAKRADMDFVRETADAICSMPADQRGAAVERANNGEPVRLADAWS